MISAEDRSHFSIRIDAVRRLILWHLFSSSTPYYLVSEFPKCGGSWVSQILSEYFDVPFPRNKNVSIFYRQSLLLHGHNLYNRRFANSVYVLRDGRDAIVSAYFHDLIPNNRNPSWATEKVRDELNFKELNDIKRNLPDFIEYKFERWSKSLFHFSWSDFVVSIISNNANYVKYEDMLIDTPAAMTSVIEKITGVGVDLEKLEAICKKFSFQQQVKRQPGQEDSSSFLRKGIAGDWKDKFSNKACEVFDKHAGEALILAGYENDHSWVNGFEAR